MDKQSGWDIPRCVLYMALMVIRTPIRWLASISFYPVVGLLALWGLGFGIWNWPFFVLVCTVLGLFALAVRYDAIVEMIKPVGMNGR